MGLSLRTPRSNLCPPLVAGVYSVIIAQLLELAQQAEIENARTRTPSPLASRNTSPRESGAPPLNTMSTYHQLRLSFGADHHSQHQAVSPRNKAIADFRTFMDSGSQKKKTGLRKSVSSTSTILPSFHTKRFLSFQQRHF